jgi:hypothetical protein
MRRERFVILGLGLLAASAVSIVIVHAQTTAVGPYYATPSWDQKIACTSPSNCPRFIVLSNWNSEAVLDRETGLVWEQSPTTLQASWLASQEECMKLTKGNRRGWRLPTISELASLVDPSVTSDLSLIVLPLGHPFDDVKGNIIGVSSIYWSDDSWSRLSNHAWVTRLGDGVMGGANKDGLGYRWCVRGGQGVNPQ